MRRTPETARHDLVAALTAARSEVIGAALALPAAAQETPFLGAWSAHDIVAHLIGWDHANLEAIEALRAGRLPGFYAAYDPDWRTFNAGLIARHKQPALEQTVAAARASHDALIQALEALPAGDLSRDYGVRSARGRRVTIEMLLDVEARDERKHATQIRPFAAAKEETMSVLNRLAIAQGRRDEAPNQELARDLAEQGDQEGIRELVANLHHADQNVRSDCIKTLYEIGYLKPELVADYAGEFVRLLRDRNNRMAWGSMIALAAIAPLRPEELFRQRQRILAAMAEGSVITVDNGVRVLAAVAAADAAYRAELLPYLFHHLQTCRPKDVPQHAEAVVQAVDAAHADAFVTLLERRLANMSAGQAARVKRVIVQARKATKQTG